MCTRKKQKQEETAASCEIEDNQCEHDEIEAILEKQE